MMYTRPDTAPKTMPAMEIHDWWKCLSAQAPMSQQMTTELGRISAIWMPVSALTMASTPVERFEFDPEFGSGRLNGIPWWLYTTRSNGAKLLSRTAILTS